MSILYCYEHYASSIFRWFCLSLSLSGSGANGTGAGVLSGKRMEPQMSQTRLWRERGGTQMWVSAQDVLMLPFPLSLRGRGTYNQSIASLRCTGCR